ncbi:sigma factor-like helix-turn-helix DNA-binding protein [Actinospongicola halichondriae]|uniref:sigma factor-like helix-turn-helix DNA-binding protein n=1 Tax=Actinospongicola halichondriae TaxID=3236844 RepID=UPI003D5C603C
MAEVSTFEQFFRAQYASLVALGAALTGDRATGEDLAQEALRITHERWSDVSRYELPIAFTRRALIGRASNERRRRGREGRALRRLGAMRGGSSGRSGPAVLDPLWSEVASLPAQQRAAVALRYVEDLSTAEIAEAMGCAEATARVHLHRAHRTLAERLGDTYESDDIEDES